MTPAGLDLDDTAPWAASAESLLDGPPGCWEIVGTASWDHDFGKKTGTRGDAVFAGRLEDGVWSEFVVYPKGEIRERHGDEGAEEYGTAIRFTPMIGQVRGLRVALESGDLLVERSDDPRVESVNTMRDVVDALSDSVSTDYLRWDDARSRVELVRETEAGKRGALVRTVFGFDGASPEVASTDLELDGTYVYKVLVTVDELSVRLRGRVVDGVTLPAAEAVRFTLHMPLFRVEARQTIVYTHVERCGT